jgi:hypothetical protein
MTAPLAGKPTFGAGRVFAIANVTNPTPARALVPQSQSIDFKRKTESLFGEKQLAVAVGAGEMEVTGKVEFGKIVARMFSDIIFGDSGTTGQTLEADKEAGMVPASTAYTVQVVNHTTWLFDLGVVNASTGVIMSCVAGGSEVAGKSYSVSAGVYTFASGDASAPVLISYAYTSSTAGETVVLTNQAQGLTGNFQAVHVLPWGTEQDMFVFNDCLAGSSGIALKKSGFANFTLEYTAAANNNDQLGTATFAEAA